MKCPHCGLEAMIYNSHTEIEGDDTPDRQTEVFARLIYHCRNPQCEKNGSVIGEVRHRVYPAASTDGQEEVNP